MRETATVRDRLLDAAAHVFEEHGFRGATTRLIAEEAGVNEVTLFRHFGTKARLLREALAQAGPGRVGGDLPGPRLPTSPADPQAELTAWCLAHMRELYAVRALIRTSMGEFEEHPEVSSCGSEMPKRLADELQRYLAALKSAGKARADVDLRVASNALLGAVFSDAMSRDIMPDRYPYALEEAPAQYVALFLRGVGPERAD